jgi:hypothetical protein
VNRRCIGTLPMLAVVLAAGCGPAHDHADPAGTSREPALAGGVEKAPPGLPEAAAVDMHDPTAVAQAALITVRMIDTTIDRAQTGDRDARARALPYLSAAYAPRLRGQPDRVPPAGQWQQWLAHRAYVRVRLLQTAPADRRSDTATTAHRAWILTTTPTGRDGWHGPSDTEFAEVTLRRARAADRWGVDQLTIGLYGAQDVRP